MKTHDLARALTTLARSLREGENMELAAISIQPLLDKSKPLGANAPAALALLVRLASYNKDEWKTLINELELDVPVKATDSVRDILGRLFKYLNDNAEIRERLIERARKPRSGNVSPELMKALNILIGQ